MATNFPTGLQDLDATRGTTGQTLSSPNHITHHTTEDDTIEAIQTKLGVDSSAVTASIDYKLKNTASVDPGHKHTPTVSLQITGTPNGTLFLRDDNTWEAPPTVANASTTVNGSVEMATQAEVLAKTATGGTGAVLAVSADTMPSTLLSDYKVDTGSANAYAITPAPAITAYTTGQIFSFKAVNANTTTSTLDVNGLGVKTINKNDGATALVSGDIAAGQTVLVEYDGTNFQMLNPVGNGPTPTGMISPYAGFTAPGGWLLADGVAVSRTTHAALFGILNPSLGAATMTLASPAVVTLVAHGLVLDDVIHFTTTGALPTGVAANTQYYVLSSGLTADAFQFSATKGGAAINSSVSQSGVHTLKRSPYGIGDGSTTFNTPNLKGSVPVGRDSSQTEFNAVGETGGAKTHTLTIAELAAHTHSTSVGSTGGGSNVTPGTAGDTAGADVGSTGGGGAHNNLQPYIALNYIIKT